jgi:hypothetical protein
MRLVTLVGTATVICVLGCGGGNKVEMPTNTVNAPDKAITIGAGSGGDKAGGGLPAPPSTPPPGGRPPGDD